MIKWGYDDHHVRIWWSSYEDMKMMTVLLIPLTPLCPGGGRPRPWRSRPWHLRGATACQLPGIVQLQRKSPPKNYHLNSPPKNCQRLAAPRYCTTLPPAEKIAPKKLLWAPKIKFTACQLLGIVLPPEKIPCNKLRRISFHVTVQVQNICIYAFGALSDYLYCLKLCKYL